MSQFTEYTEKHYPTFFGVATCVLSFHLLTRYGIPFDAISKLLPSITSLCGILIGFMSATEAVFIAVSEKPLAKKLIASGKYQRTLRYYRSAIRSVFLLLVVTSFFLVFDISYQNTVNVVILSLWFAILTNSLLACFRAIDIFSEIIHSAF